MSGHTRPSKIPRTVSWLTPHNAATDRIESSPINRRSSRAKACAARPATSVVTPLGHGTTISFGLFRALPTARHHPLSRIVALEEIARRVAEMKSSATLARSNMAFERCQKNLQQTQKSQSSSSVASALPMTYDEPDPEKKSWFSSAFGESADRMAGFTFVTLEGNIAS